MNKFRDAIERFFYGRNGMDELGQFTFGLYMVMLVLNIFTRNVFFYWLEMLLVVIFLFRCLSKNLTKRQDENRRYLERQDAFLRWQRIQKRRWADRKTHVYRKCPHCGTMIRLPKVKGKHTTNCPKCHKDFDVTV
ncbi:MAG: hypothetical protein ACOX8M_03075 [Marvinbryantia sp.]|jgi:hypothetical protein